MWASEELVSWKREAASPQEQRKGLGKEAGPK